MADTKTLTFEDFSAGIDLREGPITRDSRKFEDLENYLTTFGRTLIRRFPFDLLGGELDANSIGIGYLNGEFIAIAEAGTTVTHTVMGIPITTVYFDNPEYCTTWEVLDSATLNERVVVLIRHTFPGGAVTSRIMLHVFDDKRPTWVEDPAVPTNWSKEFPQQPFGTEETGAFKDYVPSLTVVADKLHDTRPEGNTGFSAVNRPRVWADRDANDILDTGRMFYFVTPNVAPAVFTIPIPYADLTGAQRYAAYVCERLLDNGTWVQFREVGVLTMIGDYTIESRISRFDPTKTESKITILTNTTGKLIRFRAIARPPLTITAGCAILPTGFITGGTITIEDASHDLPQIDLPTLTASTFYHLVVVSPTAPITIANAYAGGVGSMPLNGQQRYWSRIIGIAETDGSGDLLEYALTGTVDLITGDSEVVGAATAFLTECVPGGTIEVNGQTRTIQSIGSDTSLHVAEVWTTSGSGLVALQDIRYRYGHEIGDSGNQWFADREAEATFTLAGADNAGVLNTSLYDPSGRVPICLGASQNRLIVQYPECVQLWGVQPDPNLNAFLGREMTGAGVNTNPTAALIDGYVALPTHNGPMLFSPQGQNKDYLRTVRIGDLVRPALVPLNLTNAVWWARLRLFITCEHENDDGVVLWAFAFHPDDKTASWSRFTVTDLTRVDQLFIAQDTLFILSDHELWKMNADATVFRDSTDVGDAYTSRARWLYNDFGAPSSNKKLLTLDINQTGSCDVALFTSPYEATSNTRGPSVSGQTAGRQRVPLAVLSPAFGLEITSQDESGHQLNSVGFTYALMGR